MVRQDCSGRFEAATVLSSWRLLDRLEFVSARAEKLREHLELFCLEVGDGPVTHAVLGPTHNVVTIDAGGAAERELAFCGHGGEADEVLGAAVDECRHRRAADDVDAAG